MAVMARDVWTDERLDDLNKRVDEGFKETREEFRAVRAEMKSEFQAVRSEMKSEFRAVKYDLKAPKCKKLGQSMGRAKETVTIKAKPGADEAIDKLTSEASAQASATIFVSSHE